MKKDNKKKESFDLEKAILDIQKGVHLIYDNQKKILNRLKIIEKGVGESVQLSNMAIDFLEFEEGANPVYCGKSLSMYKKPFEIGE